MAETNATILIPDISGFTEFMTTTELSHSSRAIHMLIDAMLNAIGEEYEVSEIEGDAVLLIKKGPAPSKKEILGICLKIFNAFHSQRMWMQQYTICPCGACKAIINLTLKFIVHYGPLVELKVGRFIKQSGMEMIVAHRLLKNSIDSHEYLLMSEKLLKQVNDSAETADMVWGSAFEEYASIGKVGYHFALLNEARKNVPAPQAPQSYYRKDNTPYLQTTIAANFLDVYMVIMNIPGRVEWMPGLQKVEQDVPDICIGSLHHCSFGNHQSTISPLLMISSDEEINYAESYRIEEMNISLVYEFVFKYADERSCHFSVRFMNAGELPVPEETRVLLSENMQRMAEKLKLFCE